MASADDLGEDYAGIKFVQMYFSVHSFAKCWSALHCFSGNQLATALAANSSTMALSP